MSSTSCKVSLALLGGALIALGLACKKPEPLKTPEPPKIDTSAQDAADKAKRDEEARRQAEADRQRAEQAKLEAARKAEADQLTAYRQAADKALQDIHFEFDKSALMDHDKATLQGIADFLKHYPQAAIQVEGHCDERGTVDYNLGLGERRANTAMTYLKGLGVDEKRMSTISYGKEKPICTESTESCWGRNRRAHFILK